MDELDFDDMYHPGQEEQVSGNKFFRWMKHNFQHGKLMIIISFVGITALSIWAQNYAAPVVMFIAFTVVLRMMRQFRKDGQTIIVESRLQGEVITHCSYYLKPIHVPDSGVKIIALPNARWQDVKSYGDPTAPVSTKNIVFVDYFESKPNGDILMVYPKNADFGNFSLFARANDDMGRAVAEIGRRRQANEEFKTIVVESFYEGRFGDPNSYDAQKKVAALLVDAQHVEAKLGNTDAARRNIWLYYKDLIPKMMKQLLMIETEIPRLATAEASRFLHAVFDHPMSEEVHKVVQGLMSTPEAYDYEERVRALVERGAVKLRATDADESRQSVAGREVVHVR
jgi:hypothetical protein